MFINKDFEEIDRIINYFDAFTDLPWGGTDFYIYLSEKYPNAKFIYTSREGESWFISLEKMVAKTGGNSEQLMSYFHENGRYGLIYYLEHVFKINTLKANEQRIVEQYNKMNNQLLNYFKTGNYNFLHIKVTSGEGWEKLCPFLECPYPNKEFPFANKAPILENISSINSNFPKHQNNNNLLGSIFKKFLR